MTSPPDPLDMARNCAAAVQRAAEAQASDPVQAYIAGAGRSGMDAAQVGACMALVSIAGDLRRIADWYTESAPEAYR